MKYLNLFSLLAATLVFTSCARHEGFSDCHAHPELDVDAITELTSNNTQTKSPLTVQQGLQVLMGTQGVLDCKFTGL